MRGIDEYILEQVEPSYIGSFEVVNSINEDKIGTFKGKKYLLDVFVWTNDPGHIPHFHVRDKDLNIDSCVMINENRYFEHGTHTGKLNSKQRKALNDFLKEKNDNYFGLLNYQVVIAVWNSNNSNTKVNKNQQQSDYTTISNYKNGI